MCRWNQISYLVMSLERFLPEAVAASSVKVASLVTRGDVDLDETVGLKEHTQPDHRFFRDR